jgi:hypothetical protein
MYWNVLEYIGLAMTRIKDLTLIGLYLEERSFSLSLSLSLSLSVKY